MEAWRRRTARDRVRVDAVVAPRLFLVTLAVVLVIWLAYLLSAALVAVGSNIPGLTVQDANAATPLGCATPSCGPASPQDFEYTAPANTWAVVGVRSSTGGGNANVCVYADAALTQTRGCSTSIPNTVVDFVAVDYHHTTGGGLDYVRSTRASGSGDLCTTYDCGTTVMAANAAPISTSWPANQVVRAFNLVVPGAGTWRVAVAVTSGTADLGLALFGSNGQADYAAGRSAAVSEADLKGAGGGEGLYFTSTASDTFGLVVWSNTAAGTANYRLEFRTAERLVANVASDEPGTSAADFFYVPTEPRGWSVLALRPQAANPAPDADLRLYDRPGYVTQLARSSAEPGVVDFIVANYANAPHDTAAVLMVSLGPIGGYKLDWMYGPPALVSGEPTAVSLAGRVGKGWALDLVAGVPYQVKFEPTPGTKGDASLGIYGPRLSEPQFTYGTRADSLAGSDAWAESPTGWVADQGVETFLFTPQLSGSFLLYAYQKGQQTVSGTLIAFPTSLLGVPAGGAGRAAFVAPWPSPSSGGQGVRFAFDMPAPGRARLTVLDARGRIVCTVLDGALAGGPSAAAWDGRLVSGASAAPGLYFARLERPGVEVETRRFIRL